MTFIEKTWGLKRTFTVEGDTLTVTLKRQFGRISKMSFSLQKIKSEPDVHYIKDDTRTGMVGMPGLIIFLIGTFGGTIIYEKSPLGFYTILSVGIAAMIAGFIFGGKVKLYLFKNHEETGIFEITGRGNSAAAFEAFVESLKGRIQGLQSGR